MSLTLLQIVTNHCQRTNITVPATVIGSTDSQILQIRALLEEEGTDLSARGGWQGLVNEASLTTTATESQGLMSTIASNGFRYILNNTIWSRTRRLPVCGPLNPREWQMLKAMFVNGPYYRYRIRGDTLYVNPTPPVESWYFEYVSYNWIQATGAGAYKRFFTVDTDEVLLPDTLLLQGLRWRWKMEKGLDYGEDFRTYEMQVKDAIGRDGGKRVLHQSGGEMNGPRPGIFVAPGSWNV